QAAVLARLVRKVCTIEIIPPLAETAAKVLRELGYDNVSVKVGDGLCALYPVPGLNAINRAATYGWQVQARSLVKGKTVVITGGTSGIGEVAVEALAQVGARIVLVARSKSRAEATLARLRRSGPGAAHSVYFADLTRLAEMKRVAAEIANREPPIDVLINNAGALFGTRRLTEDGLEHTFALNHMSYFVVTEGLRERL